MQILSKRCQTNPSPNTIRLCQFRVLHTQGFSIMTFLTIYATFIYLWEVCKVSLEWIYGYLNSWYPQYCRQRIEQYMYGKGKWITYAHHNHGTTIVSELWNTRLSILLKLKEKIICLFISVMGFALSGFSILEMEALVLVYVEVLMHVITCWYLFFCYFYSFACSDCLVAIILWQPWSWFPHCILIYINIGVCCFCLIRQRA